MREFIKVLRRFVPPYKKFLGLSILFNVLTAFLTLFSFALIIPILQMLFKVDTTHYEYMALTGEGFGDFKEVAVNNFYYRHCTHKEKQNFASVAEMLKQHFLPYELACRGYPVVEMEDLHKF